MAGLWFSPGTLVSSTGTNNEVTRHTTLIVWTVFGQPTGQPTGTNNEVEGLHHHLNKKNGYQTPPSYKPIERLNTEASLLPVQHEFVSEDKLQRI